MRAGSYEDAREFAVGGLAGRIIINAAVAIKGHTSCAACASKPYLHCTEDVFEG